MRQTIPRGGPAVSPLLLPVVTASAAARAKVTAFVSRDFAVNPLKIQLTGDSNRTSGFYAEGNVTARLSSYERFSQYINAPATGFRTSERPFSGGCYVPFGPVPQTYCTDELGFQRCVNSSNWIKAAPPVGIFVKGQSSFSKDSASAGYASMRLDRRTNAVYTEFVNRHQFEIVASRMKLLFSIGSSAAPFDKSFGNTSISTVVSDTTAATSSNHGVITIRFWDLVGAASISSTTITATTTNNRGISQWTGWTSDWISLPSAVTYPQIEIRIETGAGVRVGIEGIWFDDGAPRIQVFDNSYPGMGVGSLSPITYNQAGVSTDTSFAARRNYMASSRFLTKANYVSPLSFDATDYLLPSAPTSFPIFSGGMDVCSDSSHANNIDIDTPAKIKAIYLAMMAEWVIDNPNGVYIKHIVLRGFGSLGSLDSFITTGVTVGGVANQTWAMLVQAYKDVQAAYPNHFIIFDHNQAIVDRYYGGVQPTATTLNNDLGYYSINDPKHTDPFVEDEIAQTLSMFISGKF